MLLTTRQLKTQVREIFGVDFHDFRLDKARKKVLRRSFEYSRRSKITRRLQNFGGYEREPTMTCSGFYVTFRGLQTRMFFTLQVYFFRHFSPLIKSTIYLNYPKNKLEGTMVLKLKKKVKIRCFVLFFSTMQICREGERTVQNFKTHLQSCQI